MGSERFGAALSATSSVFKPGTEGLTVAITGSLVGLAFLVRRHYRRFQFAATMLNLLVQDSPAGHEPRPGAEADGRVAVLFVNHYDGLGARTLRRVRSLLGEDLRRVVFLSVVQVDWDELWNGKHLEQLRADRRQELVRYEHMAQEAGIQAESRFALGTDVVQELESLSIAVAEQHPDALFVAGQVVFQKESLANRLLHNEVPFALQRRLIFRGLDMIIVPVQLPQEIW